eukprot:2309108-Pyramimonas_sp.AAC.1
MRVKHQCLLQKTSVVLHRGDAPCMLDRLKVQHCPFRGMPEWQCGSNGGEVYGIRSDSESPVRGFARSRQSTTSRAADR